MDVIKTNKDVYQCKQDKITAADSFVKGPSFYICTDRHS